MTPRPAAFALVYLGAPGCDARAPEPVAPVAVEVPAPERPPALEPVPLLYAEATSYLHSRSNRGIDNYHPNFALDDKPHTAWVEGAEGAGVGEALSISMPPVRQAHALRLELRSGYHKSPDLLGDNGAPSMLRVEALHKGTAIASTTARLERRMGWQSVDLVVEPASDVDGVRLTIEAVHAGDKYDDTVISDLRLSTDGTPSRFNWGVQDWLDQRAAVAAKQAPDPMEGLWFSQFASNRSKVPRSEVEDHLAEGRAALARASRGDFLDVELRLPPRVGTPGFLLSDASGAVDPNPRRSKLGPLLVSAYDKAGVTDASVGGLAEVVESEAEGWSNRTWSSNPQVVWHEDGVPDVVLERRTSEGCRSACGSDVEAWLVAFDAGGQPLMGYRRSEFLLECDHTLTPDATGWPVLTWPSESARAECLERTEVETFIRFDARHGRIASAEVWELEQRHDGEEVVATGTHTTWRGLR